MAGSRRSTRTSRPSAHVRDADNVSSSTRKRALSSATDPPALKRAAAMRFLSPLDTDEEDEDVDEGNNPSPPPTQEGSFYEEFVPHPDDNNNNNNKAKSGNGDDASQTTVSKSERTADLRTIFTRTSDGWVCNLCK
ncbi:hypothetical protein EDD22DRAFT_852127 [Suillus occidentalis]|nr:hypothetical protein EDD22DRAFT_852127 [Suillus occidentalis]